jgi:hypothetical protein
LYLLYKAPLANAKRPILSICGFSALEKASPGICVETEEKANLRALFQADGPKEKVDQAPTPATI